MEVPAPTHLTAVWGYGGTGFDFAYYSQAISGVRADLAEIKSRTGDVAGDTFIFVDCLAGSQYADNLYGDHRSNMLVGRASNDWLSGRNGDDSLYGGACNDAFVVDPTDGWDTIFDFEDSVDKIDLRCGRRQSLPVVKKPPFALDAGE
jgi:serralysin